MAAVLATQQMDAMRTLKSSVKKKRGNHMMYHFLMEGKVVFSKRFKIGGAHDDTEVLVDEDLTVGELKNEGNDDKLHIPLLQATFPKSMKFQVFPRFCLLCNEFYQGEMDAKFCNKCLPPTDLLCPYPVFPTPSLLFDFSNDTVARDLATLQKRDLPIQELFATHLPSIGVNFPQSKLLADTPTTEDPDPSIIHPAVYRHLVACAKASSQETVSRIIKHPSEPLIKKTTEILKRKFVETLASVSPFDNLFHAHAETKAYKKTV